eukprot:2150065-Rhodomonas_salina.1
MARRYQLGLKWVPETDALYCAFEFRKWTASGVGSRLLKNACLGYLACSQDKDLRSLVLVHTYPMHGTELAYGVLTSVCRLLRCT